MKMIKRKDGEVLKIVEPRVAGMGVVNEVRVKVTFLDPRWFNQIKEYNYMIGVFA